MIPDHLRAQIAAYIAKLRERDMRLCKLADEATYAYAKGLADRAECYGRCADELDALLIDAAHARVSPHRANRFDCKECGQGIAVDEDGCCRTCGADAVPVARVSPQQSGGPLPLRPSQEEAVKSWAADDRLWTTQETVEINLRTFARVVLKHEHELDRLEPITKTIIHSPQPIARVSPHETETPSGAEHICPICYHPLDRCSHCDAASTGTQETATHCTCQVDAHDFNCPIHAGANGAAE